MHFKEHIILIYRREPTVRRNWLKTPKAAKPYLSEVYRKKRVVCADKQKNWTVEEWKKVLWSDESNIQVCGLFDKFG